MVTPLSRKRLPTSVSQSKKEKKKLAEVEVRMKFVKLAIVRPRYGGWERRNLV